VTKNMWHSCSNYTLDHHFNAAAPTVRETFDGVVALIERNGPVEVSPQKTRISIQAKVRFAGCVVRKHWLLAHLWLTRRVTHPTLRRVDKFVEGAYVHPFRFDAPEDMDASFEDLVRESYAVGLREHLKH